MFKRILLALALAASLGGGVLACNTPAGSTSPTVAPSTPAASTPAASVAPSVEPSAS